MAPGVQLGARIRAARLSRGLTLEAVATAADGAARPVVLVGFSAAGPRLFAAADRIGQPAD